MRGEKMQGTITRIFQETHDVYGFYIKLEKSSDNDNVASDSDNIAGLDTGIDTDSIGSVGDEADKPFSFIHGQYVMLAFPDDTESKRPFSIVEYSPSSMEILVLLKRQGSFTQRMFSSKVGQRLEVFGPYGSFTLHQNGAPENGTATGKKPLVFIAAGIGITPIYSMLMEAINHDAIETVNNADENVDEPDTKVNDVHSDLYLFYTAKNKEQMPLYYKLNVRSGEPAGSGNNAKHGKIKIKYHFTEQGSNGEKSRRLGCDDVISEVDGYKDGIYYICGPVPLIESFRQGLMEKGIPEDRIRSEEFT
jgi:NAD(P)H-flavin reductase